MRLNVARLALSKTIESVPKITGDGDAADGQDLGRQRRDPGKLDQERRSDKTRDHSAGPDLEEPPQVWQPWPMRPKDQGAVRGKRGADGHDLSHPDRDHVGQAGIEAYGDQREVEQCSRPGYDQVAALFSCEQSPKRAGGDAGEAIYRVRTISFHGRQAYGSEDRCRQ